MGILSANENLLLEIKMDFDLSSGYGNASLKFELINPIPNVPESVLYMCLASLFYGRILYAHKETRTELFYIINDAADKMIGGIKDIEFENWSLNIYNKDMHIWPWNIDNTNELPDAKVYKVILEGSALDKFSINLKMTFGIEKILARASVLILTYCLPRMLNDEGVQSFGSFLKGMNNYYGTPSGAGGLLSEKKAFKNVIKPLLNT